MEQYSVVTLLMYISVYPEPQLATHFNYFYYLFNNSMHSKKEHIGQRDEVMCMCLKVRFAQQTTLVWH